MLYYLQWKGADDAGFFTYYNEEAGENKKIDVLGKKIYIKDVSYTIKGWDDTSNSAIYSNDIKIFNNDELVVKSADGEICRGLYKDVKAKILSAGAKLHIKMVGVMEGKEIVITLKGLNFFQLSETLKNINKETTGVVLKEVKHDKKGAVKFTLTSFEQTPITEEDKKIKQEEEISVEDIPF